MNRLKTLETLFDEYSKRKHPLNYSNRYQLLVMVVLSAQDSDKHINELAVSFFEAYPSLAHLAKATKADLQLHLHSVRNFANKIKWLMALAQEVGTDKNIPTTMETLTKLPGIGRKSANVIIRESGGEAEGIIVDLHVVRVAPRMGIAVGVKPEKIEKNLMALIPKERWNDAGMAISFLGREICRPLKPKCDVCPVQSICWYFDTQRQ
jgi:endonuclease III